MLDLGKQPDVNMTIFSPLAHDYKVTESWLVGLATPTEHTRLDPSPGRGELLVPSSWPVLAPSSGGGERSRERYHPSREYIRVQLHKPHNSYSHNTFGIDFTNIATAYTQL